jgi:hypothetical protein
MTTHHKLTTVSQLTKLITFCFDRFDVAITLAGMGENPQRDLDRVRAKRWSNRAYHYIKLRNWVAS